MWNSAKSAIEAYVWGRTQPVDEARRRLIDPITRLSFSIYENKGAYALLIGSGVSRAAQIPTGWEITLDLVRRVACQGERQQADWAEWYRSKYGNEPGYSEQLNALAVSLDERRSILHSYIEPSPEEVEQGLKVPTPAHRAIANMVGSGFVRVILTTNFDRLIETALRYVGVEPTVISTDDHLKGAVPLVHSRCYVVKLHGDYLDIRIKNTESELDTYSPDMDQLLDRIIDEHGLIICGWSGEWDRALRSALIRAPSRRFTTYWAARGSLGATAQDLVSHRSAKVIPIMDANTFFTALERQVSIQDELRRPHPESTELIVGSAKKYLANPEHRIRISDLIGETQRGVAERLQGSEFGMYGAWSTDEFRKRVRLYEAAAEPLVRLFGVLGRYGDGNEFPLAADTLNEFASQEPQGGLTDWINLQTYPAVLALYGYGLGALKGRRFQNLFKWLTLALRTNRYETEPAVAWLGNWAADINDLWKNLEGLERRKTPLSDHLLEYLEGGVVSDYLFFNRQYKELFEAFEILCGLAHLTVKSSKEELQSAAKIAQPQGLVWFPVGRSGWDKNVRETILATIIAGETRSSLLQAGFASGDEEYLSCAITNMRSLMEYFRKQF